ncbi:MAG: class I SAM-dependent RNA methyltransferase [Deltaproteobacteria bacterium]|nr:class I SAM-dependent RNA methyltransferase [Deltaproteobacteria bacterium]
MQTIRLRIEKYAPPGNGLGFYQGKAVFVPLAALGDELLVKIEKEKKNYVIGSLEEIIQPGPERRPAACPHYAECGGCDFLHFSYSEQLRLKKMIFNELLGRAGCDREVVARTEITASPRQVAYRHRALFHRQGQNEVFGFLKRRSHQVIAVPDCLVLAAGLRRLLQEISLRKNLPEESETLYGLTNRAGDFAAQALIGKRRLALSGIAETVWENYGDGELELAASGFAQANPEITKLMAKDLLLYCRGCENVAELYGGSGTFSLSLAAIAREVRVFESDLEAGARGRRNAVRNGCENLTFIGERVERLRLPPHCDTVVVDPPRSGLDLRVVEKILASGAECLVYISCNPATLARDLGRLTKERRAFGLQALKTYDMYPGTTHLEAMAVLRRFVKARRS